MSPARRHRAFISQKERGVFHDNFKKIFYSDLKQNKGSILKATVEYIKDLKRDQQKLHNLEDRQTLMNSKRQKLLFRIFVSKYFEKKKSLKKHYKNLGMKTVYLFLRSMLLISLKLLFL